MQISQEALKEAYAEINALREERQRVAEWSDELYEFVQSAIGDPYSRRASRITWGDIVKILHERGWMSGALNTIKGSFYQERARRRKISKGERYGSGGH